MNIQCYVIKEESSGHHFWMYATTFKGINSEKIKKALLEPGKEFSIIQTCVCPEDARNLAIKLNMQ